MELNSLSDREFFTIRDILFREAGISLHLGKKSLVCGRLFKKVQEFGVNSYGDYFNALLTGQHPQELRTVIDLLTTNETYFFREPKHFDMLSELAEKIPAKEHFRVWSAACSSGEEVYTIAMTLAELDRKRRAPIWEIRGSDISSRVLEQAKRANYVLERTQDIPTEYLKRYCLRGTGPYEGTLLVNRALRERTEFARINLIEPLPDLPSFDAIFLRNVMIYFDQPVKKKVVSHLLSALKPDGVLFIGMAESITGMIDGLVPFGPGAYRMERRR